jgi:hypothetical protein
MPSPVVYTTLLSSVAESVKPTTHYSSARRFGCVQSAISSSKDMDIDKVFGTACDRVCGMVY